MVKEEKQKAHMDTRSKGKKEVNTPNYLFNENAHIVEPMENEEINQIGNTSVPNPHDCCIHGNMKTKRKQSKNSIMD